MRLFKRVSILGISAFALVAVATPALAMDTPSEHTQTQTTEQQTAAGKTTQPRQTVEQQTAADKTTQHKQTAEQKATDVKANAETRLADTKLKACQNHEKTITNTMSRLSDRGQKQLDLFSSIADKTEAFYVQKGKPVATYDALVADVTTKKTVAEAAIATVASTSTTFKCDGTDPKGTASSFRGNLKAEIAALKEYKTAVKNLIVGVKSAQGVESSTSKTTGDNR